MCIKVNKKYYQIPFHQYCYVTLNTNNINVKDMLFPCDNYIIEELNNISYIILLQLILTKEILNFSTTFGNFINNTQKSLDIISKGILNSIK